MALDIQSLCIACKNFISYEVSILNQYFSKFFELITYEEPTALSNLVGNLSVYPLRILKNFYLFTAKEILQRKSVSNSNFVVKTEKMVTLFELSKSCLISLVEDQKIVIDSDFCETLIEFVSFSSEKLKEGENI